MGLDRLVAFRNDHRLLLSLPLLVGFFLVIRIFTGTNYGIIYGFIAALLLLRISLEEIALTFFFISILTYITGRDVEANHYLSFVYGFLFLALLKYLYGILRGKYSN